MHRSICPLMALSVAIFIASCGAGNSSARHVDTLTTTTTTAAISAALTTSTHFVTVHESTTIAVTLVDSIDIDIQVSGSTFRAKLSEPIIVEGHTLFADGTKAKGFLSIVVESGRLKPLAEMNFSVTSIQNENRHWINGSTNTMKEGRVFHTIEKLP